MSKPPGGSPTNYCAHCKDVIQDAQFIRVGDFALFHTNHFVCCLCEKPLQGVKFHCKDGKFYCPDDYALKYCHTCRHCKEKIVSGNVIQAFGGYYHPHHFVCFVCHRKFEDGKYYEIKDNPYCEEHYLAAGKELCDSCKKPVEEMHLVKVSDKSFHPACLACSHCGVSLAKQGSTYQKEGFLYCKDDYMNFFSKRCTACTHFLTGRAIGVNEEFYHQDCLKCGICNKSLTQYVAVAGQLRCPEHQKFVSENPPCSICSRTIDGNVILCLGKKLHDGCLSCQFCNVKLSKLTAFLKVDKLACQACLTKREANVLPSAARPAEVKTTTTGLASMTPLVEALAEAAPPPPPEAKSPVPAKSPASVPRAFAKIEWKKGELIGKGSFGKVYMGMNIATGGLIAVKQVRIRTTEEQDQAREIENEIQLMTDLKHENIVCLLGTERAGDKLNILMEYVPGKSLDVLLAKFGHFSERVIQRYTKQLLQALAFCHERAVVHRDIKGKNILIDTRGNLKLADFGSAKRFNNMLSKDAPSVSYNYTPLWTAPEVLVGNYNSKVDIWSLGCVVIEMSSAKPPWSECNFENPFRALYHIGNTESLPHIPDRLSPEGRAFVLRCLSRNPDTRPSAQECLQDPWILAAADDPSDD